MDDKMLKSFKITKFRRDADIEKGCAVAVGGFDGVHIGHRAMISELVSESKRIALPAVVFTFDTDDSPKNDSKLLATAEKKNLLCSLLGVDAVVSVPFSEIRDISAGDFVKDVLFDFFGAKSVVCGYDFRFGRQREGDVTLIKDMLSSKGVSVVTPSAVMQDGVPVSSTLIRALIASGNIEKANSLLGCNFSFVGEVVHGKKLGRTLGFPTLNQKYPVSLAVPRFGVYAVRCKVNGRVCGGVANVGLKPTVGGETLPLCETHLFGFSGDCYGIVVETEFIAFIRGEERFDSLDSLKAQVLRDIDTAKKIFEGVL